MLSCPLATHFETLWLTTDDEHYTRRLSIGISLSIVLHLLLLSGIWFYQLQNIDDLEQAISSGAPNLPIRVELVTAQQIKQTKLIEPAAEKKIEPIIDTLASSPVKAAAQANPVEKTLVEPKKITQTKLKQEIKSNNGNAETNSIASAPQASVADGANNNINLSELQFRTAPKIPEYPALARKRGQQGKVVLLLTVETTGNISSALIAQSSGFPLLDKSAQKAALQWQLYPFKRDGLPVRREINVPYEFNLTKG